MNRWDLEDWLTNEGDKFVHKAAAANGPNSLDSRERLIYEVWLFDTEQRNGGVAQYFGNRGLDQWNWLSKFASPVFASFVPFAIAIDRIVGHSSDPYQAVIDSGVDLDAHYDEFRVRLITELKAAS